MKKRLNVLLVFDTPVVKPRGYTYEEEFGSEDWNTENDVYKALRENGHEVRLLGICKDIGILLEELKENEPDVVFNLTEVFNQQSSLDKNFASVLEMIGVPYTGASPAMLMICNDKALHKKILRFHRIRVPRFHVFYRGHKIWMPKQLKLPLIVKPLCDEASRGISLASVVDNEESMTERVKFTHEKMKMDAIAEEYIEGREFYVSVIGNKMMRTLPVREMTFGDVSEDEPRIATYKAKWDDKYRRKLGIKNVFAAGLSDDMLKTITQICKRAYRALNIQGYARFDIRMTNSGRMYIIEANANPCLAREDEIAQSAGKAGISYNKFIQMVLNLAFCRRQ